MNNLEVPYRQRHTSPSAQIAMTMLMGPQWCRLPWPAIKTRIRCATSAVLSNGPQCVATLPAERAPEARQTAQAPRAEPPRLNGTGDHSEPLHAQKRPRACHAPLRRGTTGGGHVLAAAWNRHGLPQGLEANRTSHRSADLRHGRHTTCVSSQAS